ncbi:MAG: hypothetical protein NT040_14935 [Bacteroidetes bacterium]|nr:hypothetical protein [Bacteroidota bacterium]
MPETTPTTHLHRSRHRSQKPYTGHRTRTGYLEPVYYFSGAILLLVTTRLLHIGVLSPIFGALGIITLTISKIWKFKGGILLSIIFMFLMTMIYVWQWVDRYFIAILTADTSNAIFMSAVYEALILITMVWLYHRLLNAIHIRMSQKWFVKRSYVIIFKMLFYFLLFCLFFWMFAFVMQKTAQLTRLGAQDAAMIAGAFALLASGIPAIIYLTRSSHDGTNRHRHRHHHRHGRSGQVKNSEVD